MKGQKDQSTKSYERHNICIIFHLEYMVISKQFWKNNLRTSLIDILVRLCQVAKEYTRTQLEGIKYLFVAKSCRMKCSSYRWLDENSNTADRLYYAGSINIESSITDKLSKPNLIYFIADV